MAYLKISNETRNVVLGEKVRVASSWVDRAIGLLTMASLSPGEGLWISPCTAIHTFFMRYTIDAVFLDADGLVLGRQTLRPWRVSRWYRKSRGVLELAAGTLERTKTQVGDRIEIKGGN